VSRNRRLLALYPRSWRDRYGEEFLALLSEAPLSVTEWLDVIRGAVDAWLSAEVRAAAPAERVATNGGRTMRWKSLLACERRHAGVTPFDGMVGAGVMIGTSLVFLTARRLGWPDGGKAIASLAFPMAMTLSMPFWLMKGVPVKAQALIVGGTAVALVLIGFISAP
jgi:hypothetical protein